jgi:hypothetical protein
MDAEPTAQIGRTASKGLRNASGGGTMDQSAACPRSEDVGSGFAPVRFMQGNLSVT